MERWRAALDHVWHQAIVLRLLRMRLVPCMHAFADDGELGCIIWPCCPVLGQVEQEATAEVFGDTFVHHV
eukprot:1500469-Amphidinium_carterae.1